MAQTCQNVTISLTLPMSCQICLGKVRQPVICCNHHVFCSLCMEVWLSKSSQCPTCRVPITPDNPCKEIIGATNEGDDPQSPSLKRRLRKTRGELLLKEYEDEIERLEQENEELRNRNRAAETQLETLLEPGAAVSVSRTQEEEEEDDDGEQRRGLDPSQMQEWAAKLRAATDLYDKVKQDLEKLREANKTLRAQNVDLVQENMRLKAEVENRSPRKYGRYTVAAMEAKLQQHERDVAHLKRALERSDQYIEELTAQRDSLQANPGTNAATGRGDSRLANPSAKAATGSTESAHSDGREESTAGCAAESFLPGDARESTPGGTPVMGDRIATMRRSLSEMEEASVRTDLVDGMPSGFHSNQGLLLTTSERLLDNDSTTTPHKLSGEVGAASVFMSSIGLSSPTTPSTAIRSLSLRSPLVQSEGRVGRGCGQGQGQGRGPLSYLRRLSFDGCGPSATPTSSEQQKPSSKNNSREMPWLTALCFKGTTSTNTSTSTTTAADSPDVGRCIGDPQASGSSEAYMDAAYQEKMSELDSLISDGEGPSGSSSISTRDCEPGTSEQTDTPGSQGSSVLGFEDGQDEGKPRKISAGMRSSSLSSSSSSSLSSLSSSASSSSLLAAQVVVQVTKRGRPSGPLTSSPSKLSRRT
ncbi:ORC ubiquitin ligase 1 [Engraulis encrasicolus]|uniref:ORC ubiquitin ligase 1 n=1 Tax=Engraulis encrasicolus TaxID=184585 RepID=UPI002FCF8D18